MRRLLFIIMLFSVSIAFSQDKVLLNENFTDNKNGWRLWPNSKEFHVDIQNGVLHLEKFNKNFDSRGCLWYAKQITDLNTADDFSLALDAKFVSGGDIFDVLDIQWGVISKGNIQTNSVLYQLNVFLDGSVRLDFFNSKWDNFSRVYIKDKLDQMSFNPREFNKYELIQSAGFIHLKINNVEVYKQYIVPIEGNVIGFQHCMKGAWEIDHLMVIQNNLRLATQKTDFAENLMDNMANIKTVTGEISGYIEDEGMRVFNKDELFIYPNPFVDKFNVNFYLAQKEKVDIYLINVVGELMKKETRVFPAGEVDFTMEAIVPDGIYIVRVVSESDNRLYKKIMRVGANDR
ncbi:hypothetical protein Pedsa_1423 [Pseudopedobacter saltans DSM 12145]|uniref:Secretion system C-terminal sorting domain-containing protein n=1 Tax=Pseudopedobacter saltans (strain ATCC 51119 / DSM 12145 / JCM 21818 / CCUG 39354 / LMG 10337 / NBRC 100064 / NCIMB 13643) TaxID=762903 RepID=F0S4J7_PSESL|nr:T9SS type A sorting domain-containing protein [Pseudopedobacter saltans]ADY51988.1 hypothetical protein Pedsa_1423 [Pseudopedobacter saltans DSM 12145]